ncbi:hypothetical protein [Bradyrhizobium sp. STM 3809]|uniref:hypothetical protein n=1 Tax=Bradyrhizobium sp. STM 3809 TaxID=551936 RepID=UPI001111E048|nr:hypothetical protein [Bradyrhizobium sp. STM 3809]
MRVEGQIPSPEGGRVILYSRSHYGNYPLASYSFVRGLRGDDRTVCNDVDLVFGNARRSEAFSGQRVDSVPGAAGPVNGAPGLDGGGPGTEDQFRVGLFGTARHRIIDMGPIADDVLPGVPPAAKNAGSDHAAVHQGHVYIVRLNDDNDRRLATPIYVKLRVLSHRDNDAVLIEWHRLQG